MRATFLNLLLVNPIILKIAFSRPVQRKDHQGRRAILPTKRLEDVAFLGSTISFRCESRMGSLPGISRCTPSSTNLNNTSCVVEKS